MTIMELGFAPLLPLLLNLLLLALAKAEPGTACTAVLSANKSLLSSPMLAPATDALAPKLLLASTELATFRIAPLAEARAPLALANRCAWLTVPRPLMSRPRSVTLSDAPAFTMMPLVPAASTPAVTPSQAIVIAFVIVTAPKPPGSRQLISPLAAVFEIAPANVLHGAVRLHGSASLPTPETQVRVACA